MACCRSVYKGADRLQSIVVEEEKRSEPLGSETVRSSTGKRPEKGLNMCTISGCLSDSTLKDDNELVISIEQTLRRA